LKVAILSCFYPYRGGISQFNAALYEELGRQGVQTKAFNFKRQYPDILFPGKTQYVTEDDEAIKIESTACLDSVNPLSYISTLRKITEWEPDLVIVRYWMSWFAPSLGFVTRGLRRRGIKVISILDNVIPHEQHFFDRPLTRYFLTGSSACITLCDAVARDLEDIRRDIPHITLPHPLYSSFGEAIPREKALSALGLDPERKTLLFFGLIRHYKGLDILLEAFAKLDKSYQLIIAGEPYGSFDPYNEIIKQNNLSDRISLNLGYVRDSQVKRFFSGADLCVLPYRSATQSGVGSVSFHFNVPMLVTNVGGLKETVSDTGCGILCKGSSPEDVASDIMTYFADPVLKQECQRNIKIQKERLGWDVFTRALLDFYGKL